VFVAEKNASYLFISPKFTDFFGFDPRDFENPDIDYLDNCIHPDDLLVLGRVQERLLEYMDRLPDDEKVNYKHIFEFRVYNNDKKIVRVISQHQILENSPQGNPILLGVVDISPDQTPDAGIRFRLMNFKTGDIVPFPINESPDISLTKREMEVLKMANEGMFSKEISDKLYISIHTVNRHRQNILEKMNVNNVQEAINYARRLSLLA